MSAAAVIEAKRVYSEKKAKRDHIYNSLNESKKELESANLKLVELDQKYSIEIEARANAIADGEQRNNESLLDRQPIVDDIAVSNRLIETLQARFDVARDELADANKQLVRATEANALAVTLPYYAPRSHLLSWSKVADMSLRDIMAVIAAKGPIGSDPRIALHISTTGVPESDWAAIRSAAAALLLPDTEA